MRAVRAERSASYASPAGDGETDAFTVNAVRVSVLSQGKSMKTLYFCVGVWYNHREWHKNPASEREAGKGGTCMAEAVKERQTPKKKAGRLKLSLLLLLVGAALGMAAGFALNRVLSQETEPAPPSITSDTLVEQIRHVQELVTTEYHYRNVGELKDQMDFRGFPLPFTERRILYTFRGTIKAGVDLSRAEVTVDQETKTVAVTVPWGRIISHDMPPQDVEPYDESTGFFASFTMDDYAKLLADRRSVIEAEFLAEDYLAEAQREAGRVLETLLSGLPGMDEYTLDIRYAPAPESADAPKAAAAQSGQQG